MTRRRFYAPASAFEAHEAGARVRLAPEESRHLRDVLRLKTGDEAHVFDGEGGEFLCVVVESGGGGRSGGAAVLEVRERAGALRPESPLRLTLVVALLKGEKFDLVVQKATELGATEIVPLVTKRADVRLRDAGDALKRTARWERLALEAAKQSGRARLPLIHAPESFAAVVTRGRAGRTETPHLTGDAGTQRETEGVETPRATEGGGAWRVMFAERGGRGLRETLADLEDARPSSVVALVGPEGGWEDAEIASATDAGWSIVTLGGRTLRAETAAIAVAALLQHLFGDLR